MVTILPPPNAPRSSFGSTIGKSLGQGFQEGFNPEFQRQYQRGQLQSALEGMRGIANDPNATPYDIASALISATSQIPGSERYVGQLYDSLMRSRQIKDAPNALNQGMSAINQGGISSQGNVPQANLSQSQSPMQMGGISAQGVEPSLPKGKTGKEIEEFSDKFLKEIRPDLIEEGTNFGRVPTFDFSSRSSLTPDEEVQVRNQLNEKKYSPELQEQVINRINQSIGDRYKEALQNFNIDQNQQAAINAKWNTVKNDAPKQLAPFIENFGPKTQDFLQNRYFQYAGRQPTNLTPEAVEGRAMALLQGDIDKLSALAEQPSMPPIRQFGDIKESMDNIKETYKPLIEAGMVEAVKEDATFNKDLGLEEMHEAIWGNQTNKKIMNEISNIKPGKNKEQYISQLSSKLKNLGPNDDLVLARAMVLDSGGTISDFRQALTKAQQNGLKLSPFQENQLQEVQLPRQRPLWEIFSDTTAAPFGVVGMAFKHFANYIRGKK